MRGDGVGRIPLVCTELTAFIFFLSIVKNGAPDPLRPQLCFLSRFYIGPHMDRQTRLTTSSFRSGLDVIPTIAPGNHCREKPIHFVPKLTKYHVVPNH